MLTRALLGLTLLATLPALSQVDPTATSSPVAQDNDLLMPIPPMVSAQAFPATALSEERSNQLHGGLAFESAYYDNLLPDYGGQPITDVGYSIRPSLNLDKLTPRVHQVWGYSPSFTLYEHTGARNLVDQSASFGIQSRLSPHTTLSAHDGFQDTSNVFSQPDSLGGGSISGGAPSSPADILAPYADRLSNSANVAVAYQFSRNGMIGASGSGTVFHFPDTAQSGGLPDSNSRGGAGFYSRRLSATQYVGVTYQYVKIVSSSPNAQLQVDTNSVLPSYTAVFEHGVSLTLAAGPQYSTLAETSISPISSLTPAILASISKQGLRVVLAASYSRFVSGGGGLLGAFTAESASAHVRCVITRHWTADSSGSYSLYTNLSSAAPGSAPGGHSISGTATVERSLNERLVAQFGYARLHNRFAGVAAVTADPDSDRVFASISYQFSRPLGR